jgi:hypothetical protein
LHCAGHTYSIRPKSPAWAFGRIIPEFHFIPVYGNGPTLPSKGCAARTEQVATIA